MKSRSEDTPDDDILVKREAIMALFDPPLAKSTFHDRANRGEFASSKVPGYYLLNKSRKKLGMPTVDVVAYRKMLEEAEQTERTIPLYHAALAVTIPEAIDAGLPLRLPEAMTREESVVVLKKHKELYSELEQLNIRDSQARLAFVAGTLNALRLLTGPI